MSDRRPRVTLLKDLLDPAAPFTGELQALLPRCSERQIASWTLDSGSAVLDSMDSWTLNSDSAVLDMDSWTLSDSAIHTVHARLGGHGACWAGRLESHRLCLE